VTVRRVVVIGVGSAYRRDDGVGPAVVAALLHTGVPDGVLVTECDGEPGRLLEAWAGAELAVVVDAVRCAPSRPGRTHRTVLDVAAAGTAGGLTASSHGLGVSDAVALAHALGRAPRRVVLHAVEAADLGFGPGLTPAVRTAVPAVARAVLADVVDVVGAGDAAGVGDPRPPA
jgi:hydrogenase maturation protease